MKKLTIKIKLFIVFGIAISGILSITGLFNYFMYYNNKMLIELNDEKISIAITIEKMSNKIHSMIANIESSVSEQTEAGIEKAKKDKVQLTQLLKDSISLTKNNNCKNKLNNLAY